MAEIVALECARCGNRVAVDALSSVCPIDGGPLSVRYDMEALRQTTRREHPAQLAVASRSSLGMARYADVLPAVTPITLGEGWTPLLASRRFPNLFLKEEGANPTGTIAARGLSLAVAMARQQGRRHIAIASDGSSAGALAAYCAAARIEAHLFIPREAALGSYLEGVLCGADITLVEGGVTDCAQRLEEHLADQKRRGVATADLWLDVSSAQEPFRIEGEKTIGYEIVEQRGWQFPDAVITSVAGGALLPLSKAFEEIEQLGWADGKRPRLFGVQPAGDTQSSQRGATPNEYTTAEALRALGGRALALDGGEALTSLQEWARAEGWFLSLEGAAAAAGYKALVESGDLKAANRVVLINPRAAFRSAEALASALHLRRPGALPTSLPVGGIITPV